MQFKLTIKIANLSSNTLSKFEIKVNRNDNFQSLLDFFVYQYCW